MTDTSHGLSVLAPLAGRVITLADIPDHVFASAMMGPGIGVVPELPADDSAGSTAAPEGGVDVVAPVAGVIRKLHPHAVLITAADNISILVHLGINTVKLRGAGFTTLVSEGATVTAGQPLIRWDIARLAHHIETAGCDADTISTHTPVIAVEHTGAPLELTTAAQATAGAELFHVPVDQDQSR